MAKKDVVRLLVRLFGDPRLQEKLAKRPAAVLKSAKLSARERELLASGDEKAIRAYLGQDTVKANVVKTGLTGLVGPDVANVVKTAIRSGKKPRKS